MTVEAGSVGGQYLYLRETLVSHFATACRKTPIRPATSSWDS